MAPKYPTSSQTTEGNCRLCGKAKELCDSHVISEYFYKPLYDESHEYLVLSTDPKQKRIFEKKGIRERLLCVQCEAHINRW